MKFLLKKFHFGTDLDKMPDEVFAHLTGMSKDMVSKPQDVDSGLRKFAKDLTAQRMKLYKQGKLGMIIDGTGHDFAKLHTMKNELESEGYDTYMVFVMTSLDVAQARNKERDRVLPEKIVDRSRKDTRKN